MIIAPTITTPEIALEPDIKGVCKVGGTLVIISYPIKSAKTNIIIQLRDIWLQLKREKEELVIKLESENLSDDEKEDFKIAVEGADKVYEAHIKNIAMNVKNNFYSWKDVEKVDSELAIEIEKVLQSDS